MTLRAGTIIEAARNRHPQFTREIIPTSVASQFLTEVQYQLLMLAHQRNAHWLVRTWVIALRAADNLASVYAGSTQGAPLVEGTVSLERSPNAAGALATLDATASILVDERSLTGATANTLSDSTQSWTVDEYVGARVELTEGLGEGQVRRILSNTANQLTLEQVWEVVPDPTTTYRVTMDDTVVDGSRSTVLGAPPVTDSEPTFLVKLDASGQPYLDYATPVTVTATAGIPLPPNFHVDHGVVIVGTTQAPASSGTAEIVESFKLIEPTSQHQVPSRYCGWVSGQQLYLAGPWEVWRSVTRIEIPYLPLSPAITGASSVMILPDSAREALVSALASLMLERAAQMGVAGDVGSSIADRAAVNRELFVNHVMGAGRSKIGRIQEVW